MTKPTLEEALELLREIRIEMDDCQHSCWAYIEQRGEHEPDCWCQAITEIDEMLQRAYKEDK